MKVSTTLGEFTLELFDTAAPGTVELSQLRDEWRFNESVFTDLSPILSSRGQYVIPAGPPSSARLRLMARSPTSSISPISEARSPWQRLPVILTAPPASGSSTSPITKPDSQNGGFTVFGRVLADGMKVADAINQLPRVALAASLNELPVVNFSGSVTRESCAGGYGDCCGRACACQ